MSGRYHARPLSSSPNYSFVRVKSAGSRATIRGDLFFRVLGRVSIIPVSLQDIIRVASDLFLRSIRPDLPEFRVASLQPKLHAEDLTSTPCDVSDISDDARC